METAIREDPQSKLLFEANNKYHSQKLAEILTGIAKDLRSIKLPDSMIDKRAVRCMS